MDNILYIIFHLAQQPLFRLIGAIIILLITDLNPRYGIIAFIVWLSWIVISNYNIFNNSN